MAQKRLIASIWAVSIVGILSGACSTTQVREQVREEDSRVQSLQLQVQSLQAQVQSLRKELDLQRKKEKEVTSRLQHELDSERKKAKELTAQLEAIHPPLEGEAVPPSEMVAVPEKYLDKDVIVEGKLGASVFFRDPGGYFVLKAPDSNLTILCFFRMQDLDAASRRLLVAKKALEDMRVLGRLVRSSNGLAKEIGVRTKTGYEFHVTKVDR